MSVWRGTYNQEQHEPLIEFEFEKAHCNRCGAECSQERQCRCCMDSTIEALRAQVQAVREVGPKDPTRPGGLGVYYRLGWNDALRAILTALDGGDA